MKLRENALYYSDRSCLQVQDKATISFCYAQLLTFHTVRGQHGRGGFNGFLFPLQLWRRGLRRHQQSVTRCIWVHFCGRQFKSQLLALHLDLAVITLSLFHHDGSVQFECFLLVTVDVIFFI